MPWTNKNSYDTFGFIGEDISRLLINISPTETPLLDILNPPPAPATNVAHQWRESFLGPDVVVNSVAINSATAATGIQVNGLGNQLQVGMLLEVDAGAPATNEIVQISSVVGANSILVNRNFASRGVSSLVAGGNLFVISTAELEGADTSGDVYRPMNPRTNYCQIFKKPVTISGTAQAVTYKPVGGSQFDLEASKRLIEVTRDLEKALIRGAASGNSIGSGTAYRTMDGLRAVLTQINSTVAANSFQADPVGYLTSVWQSAYNAGARDIDVIVAGPTWKAQLSAVNAVKSYILATQGETTVQRVVEEIKIDFGAARVIVSPWMPGSSLMGISTRRVFVAPLQGRQFGLERLAKTGDSEKGHVIGEYTAEFHHPEAMFFMHI